MADYKEMLNNPISLSVLDIRTINRYHLHPQNKRMCSECFQIYSGIRENFHIKKYTNSGISWNVKCSDCFNAINRQRTSEYRKSYSNFIKLRLSSYKNRANEVGVQFNLDSEYLINLFENQMRKVLLHWF